MPSTSLKTCLLYTHGLTCAAAREEPRAWLVLSQDSESLSAAGKFEEQGSEWLGNLHWTGSQLELNSFFSASQDLVGGELGDAGHWLAVEHDEAASDPVGQGEVCIVEEPFADVPALVLSASRSVPRDEVRGGMCTAGMWPRAADHVRKLLACACLRPVWASHSSISA